MIRSRATLYRMLQEFFETELMGLHRWDRVRHFPAIPDDGFYTRDGELLENPDLERGRRRVFGKYREIVQVQFGDDIAYDLRLLSVNEHPPLGMVTFDYGRGKIDGPLDPATWKQIGAFIKTRTMENV